MPEAKELVRRFDRKHGPEKYSDGTFYYFSDGSTREVDPMGLLLDAECLNLENSEEEFLLRQNQVHFFRLKLEVAVAAFDELHTNLGQTASINEADLQQLEQLRKTVEQRRTVFRRAHDLLNETKKGRQQRIFREGQQQEQARIAALQERRRAIRI